VLLFFFVTLLPATSYIRVNGWANKPT